MILSGDAPRGWALRGLLIVAVAALALAPLLFPGAKALSVAEKICVMALLAASYDLLLGYAGIVSFAHVMFFGIGSYGVALALYGIGPSWGALALGAAGALVFAVVLAAVAVPGTALAVPTFLLFSHLHLTNTPWSVIIPSLVSPFGLYLIWVYAQDAVPAELLEAARIDGAGEVRTFFQISLRLLTPGVVTVLLFTVVATWNNYFLPLIMLSTPQWYPLTVGLNDWDQQSFTAGGQAIYNLVITGSLLTVIPIMVAFLVMQRYWRSGLAAGSVKQ